MEILDKVKQIVADQLGIDEDEVLLDASFIDDLGADSLDVVELIMAFEEEFDLEIPDEDAEKIILVKDAVEYLKNNIWILNEWVPLLINAGLSIGYEFCGRFMLWKK